MFFLMSTYNCYSQNLISNGSFERRQEQPDGSGIFLKPKTISFIYESFVPPDYNDEITRCLCNYNNNNQPQFRGNPNPENRHLVKSNGGCDGWYNPLNEIININEGAGSTPDYFNREVNQNNYLQKMVWVPNNFFNNYGQNSDQDKQQPFDDNDNGQPDEDAYIGLLNTRLYSDTTDYYNYAEYITQRFESPLLTNKVYVLKFHVSWTNNGAQTELNPRQTGHYLKGIGAYFTSTDPFITRRNRSEPLNLEDRQYGLVYDQSYFSNDPQYYNQTGGPNGTNWHIITNQFTPEEDKNFITLGNFQLNWATDNRVRYIGNNPNFIPNDEKLRVYYFIDAVEVFEKPGNSDCACEGVYNVTVKPKLSESGNGECCYIVELNTYYDVDICHSNKVKIYLANADGTNKTFKFEYTTNQNEFLDFAKDLVIYDNLCFNQNEKGQTKKIFIELYYNNDFLCETSEIFEVQCLCDCPPDRASWLHYKVVRDGTCPDSGCRLLIMGLELPENITCYTHYRFERPDHILLPVKEFYNTSDPFWQSTFCIPNGGPSTFKLYLMRGPYHSSTDCIIQGIAVCDSNTEVQDTIPMGCHTDCEDDPWIYENNKPITLSNGCIAYINYRYRIACRTTYNYQDLEILDYSLLYMPQCTGMTTSEVYQAVLIYLIDTDPMGFDPLPGSQGCNDLWRIINASCWKDEMEYIGPGRCEPGDEGVRIVQKACDSVECCIQRIRVCRSDIDPKLTITPQGEPTIPDPYDCIYIPDEALNYDPLYPVMHPCHTACNWVHWSESREAVGSDEIYDNNSITRFNLKGNTLILQCDSREECKLTIEFFDILGNSINIYTEQSRENVRKIDMSGLVTHNGFYTYRVSLDGILIGFGKFIKE